MSRLQNAFVEWGFYISQRREVAEGNLLIFAFAPLREKLLANTKRRKYLTQQIVTGEISGDLAQ